MKITNITLIIITIIISMAVTQIISKIIEAKISTFVEQEKTKRSLEETKRMEILKEVSKYK